MLVCQCNVISRRDIVSTIQDFLAEDEWQFITPLKVYHSLNKRGRCCGCFPNVVDIIVETTEAWHREKATPEAEVIDFLGRLRAEHKRMTEERARANRERAEARLRKRKLRVA